jgi:hypothetical protein
MIMGAEALTIVQQQWLLSYWFGKCGDRGMPTRGDIDPVEISPKVLPNISLLEVGDRPRSYRFRLAGTAYRQALGCEPTGRRLDHLPVSRAAAGLQSVCDRAAAQGRPVFEQVRFVRWDGVIYEIHALRLPLSADGEHVSMLLAHDVFVKQRAPAELVNERVLA